MQQQEFIQHETQQQEPQMQQQPEMQQQDGDEQWQSDWEGHWDQPLERQHHDQHDQPQDQQLQDRHKQDQRTEQQDGQRTCLGPDQIVKEKTTSQDNLSEQSGSVIMRVEDLEVDDLIYEDTGTTDGDSVGDTTEDVDRWRKKQARRQEAEREQNQVSTCLGEGVSTVKDSAEATQSNVECKRGMNQGFGVRSDQSMRSKSENSCRQNVCDGAVSHDVSAAPVAEDQCTVFGRLPSFGTGRSPSFGDDSTSCPAQERHQDELASMNDAPMSTVADGDGAAAQSDGGAGLTLVQGGSNEKNKDGPEQTCRSSLSTSTTPDTAVAVTTAQSVGIEANPCQGPGAKHEGLGEDNFSEDMLDFTISERDGRDREDSEQQDEKVEADNEFEMALESTMSSSSAIALLSRRGVVPLPPVGVVVPLPPVIEADGLSDSGEPEMPDLQQGIFPWGALPFVTPQAAIAKSHGYAQPGSQSDVLAHSRSQIMVMHS